VIPEGRRSLSRKETDQASERSDAGTSMLPRLIGIVKWNRSGAKRRMSAASRERGAGKGAQPLSPPQHTVTRARPALYSVVSRCRPSRSCPRNWRFRMMVRSVAILRASHHRKRLGRSADLSSCRTFIVIGGATKSEAASSGVAAQRRSSKGCGLIARLLPARRRNHVQSLH
jgi:hypothetical protein